ncbi:MAG: hypothetical protein JSS86_06610 [Cyanobacteria bacterium SZAS LIN-2]|nr:hypothetical protein [Cyanobacteria bacterium SZAS LIN-3]MBS1995962.1 hypothetical protein [Cyanobacteria bacterium SZAS LIN-2]MBS2010034.1 hypothetical protein [Cyanobacteria bacterium SZAS TMP-1]
MQMTPTVVIAILAGLVLIGFCLQMIFNNGNPDWTEFAQKYPVTNPFTGTWIEGHHDLGAPSDNNNGGKLGMGDGGIYIEPKTGSAVFIPFSQVTKAEKLDMGEGMKPICYLTLDGDFKVSLPEEFVKSAGDKITVVS